MYFSVTSVRFVGSRKGRVKRDASPALLVISRRTFSDVTAAELTSLAIGPASPHVALGFTAQLVANGVYTDGTQIDPATVTWTSDQPAVATIATSMIDT